VTNFDVTPVGRAPGEGAGSGPGRAPGGRGDGSDPFGSLPTVRRRGWVRIVVGAIALVAGVVATIAGIVEAVEARGEIESEAVARGEIRYFGGELGPPLTFEVPPGGSRDYSVWLIFGRNLVNREREEDAAVRDSGCQATLANERQVAFGGSTQGTRTTIGSATSLGSFSAPPGEVALRCAYGPGSLRSRGRRPDQVSFVVAPGKTSATTGGVLLILGGVFGGIAGGFLLAWGWRGSRRRI
jgi:hypothetical protein